LTPLDPEAPKCLPPKTVRLISRRRLASNASAAESLSGKSTAGSVELTTEDGSVTYLIVRTPRGLSIQRTQRRPLGTQVIQAVVLASLNEFERWLGADAVRFEHPLIYERLIGAGHDFLATDP
jgi:transposase